MRIKLLAFFGIIFFVGCTSTSSDDVLGKKEMQDVLWDIIQAETYVKQFVIKDSTKNITEENIKLQKQIFNIHKITKDDFYRSYQYYQNHPTEMISILDSIEVKGRKIENKGILKPVKKN